MAVYSLKMIVSRLFLGYNITDYIGMFGESEMKKEKKKREISRGRAIKNNLYAVKLLTKICPSMVTHGAISRFLGYFEWLFYSAFFMRFVINSLQSGDSFGRIMLFVSIVTVVACAMSFYDKFLVGYRFPINNVIVNKELYKLLFKKSADVRVEYGGCTSEFVMKGVS